jgi:DNA-binding FadR family transcriptional regulator
MRQLASDLGVSVSTVREAIAHLQGEGLLDVRHGIGCFVVRRTRAARALKAAARRASRREISDMRVVVEPAVAAIAARRGSRSGIAALLSATWEREAARRSRDPDAFVEADLAFHRCVAASARGPIGIAAYHMAGFALRPVLRAAAPDHAEDGRLADLHRALAEAIGQGRAHRAARAARAIAWIETRPP